jgi:hypothetical protein
MAADAARIPDPPLVSVSPADVATAVAARLHTQLPQRMPLSHWQTHTSLPTAAFEALVTQVVSEAVDALATAWPRAVAEEQARTTAAATHHRELAHIAGQWNQRSRPVGLLGSPGLGCGVNVLPYLHRSAEGRAMHATSQEIGRACRLSSTRWAVEVLYTTSTSMGTMSMDSFVHVFGGLIFDVTLCLHVYVQLRGEFVRSVGSQGASVGQFNGPTGLAMSPDETRLLVVDMLNRRVVVADATDGRWVRTLQGPAGTLMSPACVAMVARTGQVLVVDYLRDLVVVFAGVDDDTVVRTLGDGFGRGPRQLQTPCGMAVLDEGDAADRPVAVVADTHNDRLSLFRVDDDTLLRHVGSKGAAPGQFNEPRAVSVVSSRLTGNGEAWLVVGDSDNRRVQVLTLLGVVVRVLSAGDGVGPLGDVLNSFTVCEATGELLVSDLRNHRVVSWRLCDGEGCRVVCGTGEEGSGDGQFKRPAGLFTTSRGALWVVDSHNHRLCLFR